MRLSHASSLHSLWHIVGAHFESCHRKEWMERRREEKLNTKLQISLNPHPHFQHHYSCSFWCSPQEPLLPLLHVLTPGPFLPLLSLQEPPKYSPTHSSPQGLHSRFPLNPPFNLLPTAFHDVAALVRKRNKDASALSIILHNCFFSGKETWWGRDLIHTSVSVS